MLKIKVPELEKLNQDFKTNLSEHKEDQRQFEILFKVIVNQIFTRERKIH